MREALGNFDQAMENTTRIAAMCDLQLDFSKRYCAGVPGAEGEARGT